MSSLITAFTSRAVGWPGSLRAALAGGGAPLSVLLLVAGAFSPCPAQQVSSFPPWVGRFSSFAAMPERDPRVSPVGGEHRSGAGARAGWVWVLGVGMQASPSHSRLKQLVQHGPYLVIQCINKGF